VEPLITATPPLARHQAPFDTAPKEWLKCLCATRLFFHKAVVLLVTAIGRASIYWKWLTVKLLQDLEQPSRRTNDVVVAM
jgi:hypothetical protein